MLVSRLIMNVREIKVREQEATISSASLMTGDVPSISVAGVLDSAAELEDTLDEAYALRTILSDAVSI